MKFIEIQLYLNSILIKSRCPRPNPFFPDCTFAFLSSFLLFHSSVDFSIPVSYLLGAGTEGAPTPNSVATTPTETPFLLTSLSISVSVELYLASVALFKT